MKVMLSVAALLLAVSPVAHAASNPAIGATIQRFSEAMKKGDLKAASATHVAAPVILDEVPPHRWSGPGALGRWWADYEKDAKAAGLADPVMTIGAPTRVVESGSSAYAVAPGDYTFKQKGKAMRELGQFTFVMTRAGKDWKIAGWSWTGPDPSAAK